MSAPNNNAKVVSFRMSHRTREQLKRLANDRQCTKTAVVVQLLERADFEMELKQNAESTPA